MGPPISKRNWCNADAVIKLIHQGMDLTQQSHFFEETLLHYWAGGLAMNHSISYNQEDSLKFVKLFVENDADELLAVNSWGFTPLIEAANGPYQGLPNLMVLDFLLERKEYSRAEKIEAMELAGAVILQTTKNAFLFHKAFDYWRKALHLRNMEVDDSGFIEKPRLNLFQIAFDYLRRAFHLLRLMKVDDSGFIEKPRLNLKNVQITEWNTSAELEDVIGHPDKFFVQSFLVRLRIFSTKSLSAINILILSFFDDYLREMELQLRFVEIFKISWAILETLLSRSDLHDNKAVKWRIDKIVKQLVDVFPSLNKNASKNLTEEIIKKSLYFLASATEFNCPIFYDLIRFVRILSKLPPLVPNKFTMETLSKVRDQHGRNLLHEAILVAKSDANIYATVRLLLCAGCDPNAIDKDGNTPLHFLAKLSQRHWFADLNIIAVLLLDFGAQLSLKNVDGETTIDLMIRKNNRNHNMDEDQGAIGWKLPDWCTKLPTLTSLSARVICRNRIPYLELPATLILVIEKRKLN